MQQEQITKILTQLADHETRLKALEGEPQIVASIHTAGAGSKQKTLREIIKGKKLKNGQEQVAAIVGYYEKILSQRISKDNIKEEWANAKMNGTFAAVYLSRAKDTLIRILDDGTCDLTQSGEEFFEKLLNNEPSNQTLK